MAISVTANMTDVSLCEAITGWAGGISQFAVETGGVNIEGSGSLCAWIDATTSAIEYYTITSVDLTGQHVYAWMYCSGKVDTRANGGFRIVLYTDASNYAEFYVGGSDTHFAQWNLLVCDPSSTDSLVHETGTFDPTDVTRIGVRFKTLTNAIKKGQTYVQNCFWDAVRYGTGLTVTSGATDGITLEDIFDEDMGDSSNVWGVVQKSAGAYVLNGALVLGGTGTESIDFESSNDAILCPDNPLVSSTFHTIQVLGNATGTSNFDMQGSFVKASNQPIILDLDGSNLDTVNVIGNTFVNVTAAFAGSQTVTNNVFSDSEQVVPSTSTFTGNTIKQTVATDGGLLYPDGSTTFSDNTFLDNTTGAGIEHTSATGSPFAYSGMIFDGNTYDVNNTSGSAIVINKNDGSDPSTYTGSAVTFVGSTVTTTVHVQDSDGADISGARVLVEVTSGVNFPYQDSVTVVGGGTTVTVTHTGHGLATDDWVIIDGCTTTKAYNGVWQITVTDANTYTYSDTATGTAGGTPTATLALIQGTTDANGDISDSRVVGTDQPVAITARKASSSPYYKPVATTGTVDNESGVIVVVQLSEDE